MGPAVLADLLRTLPPGPRPPDLLVGAETSDDAAVWEISLDADGHRQGIVSTTDFFMPIVDDPFDFGRIAATNALSDVWAMGGRPLFALALLGAPVAKMHPDTIRQILAGGQAACAAVGVPIAGGHSIDAAEPIYGLAVTGLVRLDHLKRNSGAQSGDLLVIAKPLGIGILSAALKKQRLDPTGIRLLIDTATRPNAIGATLATLPGVHAMTDVTGFGLLGHLGEMVRGSGLSVHLDRASIPFLPLARTLYTEGFVTGASARNWTAIADLLPDRPDDHALLCDPQTAGPLLLAIAPSALSHALDLLHQGGFPEAVVIGRFEGEGPGIRIS
jgi:selenide,water dikinase